MSEKPRIERLKESTRGVLPWLPLGMIAGAILGFVDALDFLFSGYEPALGTALLVTVSCTIVCSSLGGVLGAVLALLALGGKGLGFRWQESGLGHNDSKALKPVFLILLALAGGTAFIYWINGNILHSESLGVISELAGLVILLVGIVLAATTILIDRKAPKYLWVAWLLVAAIPYYAETRLLYQFSKYGDLRSIYGYGLLATLMAWIVCLGAASPKLWKRCRRLPVLAALLGFAVAAAVLFNTRGLLLSVSEVSSLAVLERTRISGRAAEYSAIEGFKAAEIAASCGARTQPETSSLRHTQIGSAMVNGVVLVFVDALRDDRLGKRYGKTEVTPRLNAMAASSSRFLRSYGTIPATRRAFFSLMSGRYAPTSRKKSLPILLAKAKIKSMMGSLHPLLDVGATLFSDYTEFGNPEHNKRNHTSEQSLELAKKIFSESKGQPFFAFIHFYDPHEHYLSNSEFDFGSSRNERYDAEVALTDAYIGKLMDELQAQGLADSTAVIVVSDHGEELGEHGYYWHRLRMYDESTRLAHIIHVPGTPARKFEEVVSLLDIPPTILDLLGQPIPSYMIGRSLVPSIVSGSEPPSRVHFMHSADGDAAAIVDGFDKVIANRHTGLVEHYDLRADPRELHSKGPSPKRRELRCRLAQWMTKK